MITIFQNDKGRSPPWLTAYSSAVFKAVWKSYDLFFKRVFGDGERTVEDNDNNNDNGENVENESMVGEGIVKENGTFNGSLPGREKSTVM